MNIRRCAIHTGQLERELQRDFTQMGLQPVAHPLWVSPPVYFPLSLLLLHSGIVT